MNLFKSGTRRMLRDIESELRFTRGLIGKDALDARVMAAMARLPRERFVPGIMRPLAFRNGPLPIERASAWIGWDAAMSAFRWAPAIWAGRSTPPTTASSLPPPPPTFPAPW